MRSETKSSTAKSSSSGSKGFGADVLNTTKYLLGFGPRKSTTSTQISSDFHQLSSPKAGQGGVGKSSVGSSSNSSGVNARPRRLSENVPQEVGMLPHIKVAAGKSAPARNSITRDRGETNLVSISGSNGGKGGGALTGSTNTRTMTTRSSTQTSGLASMVGGLTMATSAADPRDPRNAVPVSRKPSRQINEYQTGSTQSWSTPTMFASMSPYSISKSSTMQTILPATLLTSPQAATAPQPAAATQSPAKKDGLCCDKCDGKHETENCPYYKKQRDDHIDAKKNGWKLVGGTSNLPGAMLRSARVVSQPGDGSCLFHSLSYGIKDGSTATTLRREICEFIHANPATPICETPLGDWVKWDSGASCADYAKKMSRGSWGGGIEMACMSRLKGCNVHVYERDSRTGGYKRISAFDFPVKPEQRKIVRVLYRGGVHYDALVSD